MAITMLEHLPAPPAAEQCVSGLDDLPGLVAEASQCVQRAGEAPVDVLADEALGSVVSELARIESRAVALRMALMAEADRRRVAEQTAETGTDAWVARLTGTTREQAAGGIRLARLLRERYAATRAAFAAGRLRVEQVRVIVAAAEQAPAEATTEQVQAAEEWLVAKATGAGTRSGRGLDAKGLRQAARRMFAHLDPDLADRHQAILLGWETRTAQAETFVALHDNGDGSYSGRFRVPELHGHLLKAALDRLTAPRRLGRDRRGNPTVDESAPGGTGGSWGINVYETQGAAFCELIEHLPTGGWPGHGGTNAEVIVTIDLDTLTSSLGAAGLDGGCDHRRRRPPAGLHRRDHPRGPRRHLDASGPGPLPPPAHPQPTPRPVPAPPHLRHRRLHPPLRLVRDPPPPRLEPRRTHRPRQRPPPVRTPPPTSPRNPIRPPTTTRRRMDPPPPKVSRRT